jgi:hypothetical protein
MTDSEHSVAREVHALLLSAHPHVTDPNLGKASELASGERNPTVRPGDDFRTDTLLAIQNARQAIVAGASAAEGEKLLLVAIRAAERWVMTLDDYRADD